VKYHAGVVNVILLQTNTSDQEDGLVRLDETIRRSRLLFTNPRSIQWLPDVATRKSWTDRDDQADPPDTRRYFKPLSYACWGGFDLASCFISPTLDLPSLLREEQLAKTGQHIHRGILPQIPSGASGSDFNAEYIAQISDLQWQNARTWHPPQFRFFAFAQLKLSLKVTWPADNADADLDTVESVLGQVWNEINDWRAGDARIPNAVAVCQSFGWSELMVVAHSNRLASLINLVRRLRSIQCTVRSSQTETAHIFLTTSTKLGYDRWCELEVCRRLHLKNSTTLPVMDEPVRGEPMPVERLFRLATSIVSSLDADPRQRAADVPDDPRSVLLTPAFSVAPGHEAMFSDLVNSAVTALRNEVPTAVAADGAVESLIGPQDVATPMLRTGVAFSDILATTYLSLLQYWLFRNGVPSPLYDEHGKEIDNPDDEGGLITYFRCQTSVGQLVSANTVLAVVRPHAKKTSYADIYRQEFQEDFAGMTLALRRLQVPFASTEQILNLLRIFRWADDNMVLWEDNLTLAPLVKCLASHLEAATQWLNTQAAEFDHRAAEQVLVRVQRDLRRLIAAFRSNFHNRHLAGYVADQMPDLNLWYRGSVHQLRAISHMILDNMVEVVMGQRASLVNFGPAPELTRLFADESLSPTVGGPCAVIVADIPTASLTNLLLLDSLGHEVGHRLVYELLERAEVLEHEWSTGGVTSTPEFCAVRDNFDRMVERVFCGTLQVDDAICEVISDYIELLLLEGDNWEPWLQSLILRAVVLATPVDLAVREVKRADGVVEARTTVPMGRDEIVMTVLIRACHVMIMRELASSSLGKDFTMETFADTMATHVTYALTKMRHHLLDRCLVGQFDAITSRIRDEEAWRTFVDFYVIRVAPWLMTTDAVNTTKAFFESLDLYISSRANRLASSNRIWGGVRKTMRDLRAAMLEHTLPAIHVIHWIDTVPLSDAPASEFRTILTDGVPEAPPPWMAAVLPLSADPGVDELGHPRAIDPAWQPKVVINQRGRIDPCDEVTADALLDANTRFIGDLAALLPAWRHQVTIRLKEVEDRRKQACA
jgi:hypothetical protein